MKIKFVRGLIATILFVLFGTSYLLYKDEAEKNKNLFFVLMVIFGVCFALFGIFARKYEEQDEADAEKIEKENFEHEDNKNRFWRGRTLNIALKWIIILLIFFILFIINNDISVLNIFQSGLYYLVGFLAAATFLYYGSIYLGHFFLKLIWGHNYEHDGVAGLKNLRIFFGAGAIIVIFYIGLFVYKLFR